MAYSEFLASKHRRFISGGIDIQNPVGPLYDFQWAITKWAMGIGRACIFADCGLGKTIMQLEWAQHVAENKGDVLILTPLAVAEQTEREAERFGYMARYADSPDSVQSAVTVTNYEKLDRFDPSRFVGVVLDESSILKAHTGARRNAIIDAFASHRFKLACSATPAPNDFMELGNHAEFMGAMTRTEMLSMYFIHDGGSTQNWRLKGHAHEPFWRWVSEWAIMLSSPTAIGFDGSRFDLPAMNYENIEVSSGYVRDGMLLNVGSPSLTERRDARRASLKNRCEAAAKLTEDGEQWLLWCGLNDESKELTRLIPDAVEVKGSDSPEHKSRSMLGFADGTIRVLVTKPSIAGFGMNWQNCHQMAFVGLSDSYEQLYQATRRCWRYGQIEDVTAWIISSDAEGAVLRNVKRKEKDHREMQNRMAEITRDFGTIAQDSDRVVAQAEGPVTTGDGWELRQGDSVEQLKTLEDESIGYSVFSPPFASLYTYSDSPRDMGNCADDEEFYTHFRYLAHELYRVLKPGRLLSFHCMLIPTSKVRDGVIGLKDFRGDLIRIFQDEGMIYHSEVCIWKDPVTAMQRTKALGLLHKQIRKDSAMSRQGVPDYVVTMRKPGENAEPIAHDATEFPVSLWQKWASPIWTDINPSDTLQFRAGREESDERHICPLQLDVIRRCIGLWTNRGDLVLSPFAGIGSEGVESIKWGRRFIGIELKPSYADLAVKNLRGADESAAQGDLFS